MPKTAQKTNLKPWEWTPARERAAGLVALDSLDNSEIAAGSGVSPYTLRDWKQRDEFRARVDEIRAEISADLAEQRKRVRETGYAVIEERVKRKCERLRQLEEVRLARALLAFGDAVWMANGGSTGLVVRRERSVGQGLMAQVVTDFSVDSELIRTEMALDEAIAKELGQHIEKREIEVVDNSAAAATLDEKIEGLARRLSNVAQGE